jgi:hypothetical protein
MEASYQWHKELNDRLLLQEVRHTVHYSMLLQKQNNLHLKNNRYVVLHLKYKETVLLIHKSYIHF